MDYLDLPMDERVKALEAAMHAMPGKVYIEPVHRFAQGLYAREVTLPAGTTAVGHTHLQEHMCIISQGRCLIVAPEGNREVSAPHAMIVPAGAKNCVHAIEETVWTTVHATDCKDVGELERTLVYAEPVANMGLVT